MPKGLIALYLLVFTTSALGVAPQADDARVREQIAGLISVGDNLWLGTWLPVDSPAAVGEIFQYLNQQAGCTRIIWRGQEEWWLENAVFRPEYPHQYDYWINWVKRRVTGGAITTAAVDAARANNMEIWYLAGLFDYGAQANVSAGGAFPHPHEMKIRLERPETVPADRYGIRGQPGPIEFADAEARTAMAHSVAEFAGRADYDGVWLYTYIENFGYRYADEFGFNKPIVDEYKRRYGVDILTEPFDTEKLAALRGEYVTEFLRQLKAELQKKNQKLGIILDGNEPDLPQRWLATPATNGVGRIRMDWRTWATEGIVDELMIYCGGDTDTTTPIVLDGTKNSACKISVFQSAPFSESQKKWLHPDVGRVIFASDDNVLFPVSTDDAAAVTAQSKPAGSSANATDAKKDRVDKRLSKADGFTKLELLHLVFSGKATASFDLLAAATKDPAVMIRREALRAMTSAHPAQATPVLLDALHDSEGAIRGMALLCLEQLKATETIEAILESLGKFDAFDQGEVTATVLAGMVSEETVDRIAAGLSSNSPRVRQTCIYALGMSRQVCAIPTLVTALTDQDEFVRHRAAAGLERTGGGDAVFNALLKALVEDPSEAVQNQAARTLASMANTSNPQLQQIRSVVIAALRKRFSEYGTASERKDTDWGYRVVGNALRALQPEGPQYLEECISQSSDVLLAKRAWLVVHQPQEAMTYTTSSAEADAEAYKNMPDHIRNTLDAR